MTIAAIDGEAGTTREPRAGQPTERVVEVDDAGRRLGRDAVEEVGDAGRDRTCEHQDEQVPDAMVEQRDDRAADQEHDREHARPDDDHVDDPRRNGVEPAEQLTAEFDERVAEEPLHEQREQQHDRGHGQPQDVGRRTGLAVRGRVDDDRFRGLGGPAHDITESGRARRHLGTMPLEVRR